MTDDDKKKTACLFITLSDRVKKNNCGVLEHVNENAKKYFDKFDTYSVVPIDDSLTLVNNFADKVKEDGIDNLQVIFDIHGDKDALITDSSNLKNIIESTVWRSGAKNIEMFFANCYGSSNVREDGDSTSIHSTIKAMSTFKGNKVSTYFMPNGHAAHIAFTKNGDIFFISNDATSISLEQEENTDNLVEHLYRKQDPKDDYGEEIQMVYKHGCWHIPAETYREVGQTNILEGIYKDRPPRKYDINVDAYKEVSTDIVPSEQPIDSTLKQIPKKNPKKNVTKKNKITYKKLNLNLNTKNKINTTIKK